MFLASFRVRQELKSVVVKFSGPARIFRFKEEVCFSRHDVKSPNFRVRRWAGPCPVFGGP